MISSTRKNALSITRKESFSKWYQAVVSEAGLAEHSSVRGCMVIKPWGYAIWENMQAILDNKFKEYGVMNCYFPLFIPVDLFSKEAEHVSGFAKEMAIVTHSKLENIDGKLVPTSPIETPLAVRPTSEMIIGESFAKWTKSYRDLPLKINQWCNVVRWEMRTRLFLRTMEFLWQEGHTAHAIPEEAIKFAYEMHKVYNWFISETLKIPTFVGEKPHHEKFPGAVTTLTIEAMMQDGKALQAATSHYLGQHFAKAVGIQFQNQAGNLEFAYTTSWGCSTRMIGGLIMAHGDDDGINIPISITPYHIVIIPIIKDETTKQSIMEYCSRIKSLFNDKKILIDTHDESPQNKKWDYIRKGVPIICEIGHRDLVSNTIFFTRRQPTLEKQSCSYYEFEYIANQVLIEHDQILAQKAMEMSTEKTNTNLKTFDELKEFFEQNQNGVIIAKWCENPETLSMLDEIGVTIRCAPLQQSGTTGPCILTGVPTQKDFVFAKAY